MKISVLLSFCALLPACGRYADFSLPAPSTDGPRGPFFWQAASDPVLSPGAGGEWDSVDVLNPSVIRFHGEYWNFYSGYDGRTWSTGAAVSDDGVAWRKKGRVLSPAGWEGSYIAANGSALMVANEILYWYVAGDPHQIALARSSDGMTWVKSKGPVVGLGPRGSFDERAVADPYVIREGNRFYLFYLGMDRAQRQSIGMAQSSDGIQWVKLRANPILEPGSRGSFDEAGLGEPAVWSSAGLWWMLYTGRDIREERGIGLAKSSDGVHWERATELALIRGNEPWSSKVICDPSVEISATVVRVWFGGGDVASPDQNLHGRIGLGMLRTQK